MPGTDGRSGAQRSAATVMTPEAEMSSDEGLTTALSAFLAQLHSGFDEPETMATAAGVVEPAAQVAGNTRQQRAGGGLPHRTPGATQQATKAAFTPLHPITSNGQGGAGRVPAVDAWGAAAVLAGQRDASAKQAPPKVLEPPEKIVVSEAAHPTPPGRAPIVRKPSGPTKVAVQPKAAAVPQAQVSAPASAPAAKKQDTAVTAKASPDATPKKPKLQVKKPEISVDFHKLASLRELPGRAQALATKIRGGATRERLIGAGVGVVLVTSLGFTLSWGMSESSAISQKTAQLTATQASLSTTAAQLSAAQQRITHQLRDLNALNGSDLHWKTQSLHLQAQLAQTQAQLTQAQQRVGLAQSQLDQAQGQLGTTQHSLIALTQSHASQCQRAAVLAQNSVSVNNSVVITETQYLAALKAGNRSAMTQYLGDMNALQGEASSIGAQLTSSMNACLGG